MPTLRLLLCCCCLFLAGIVCGQDRAGATKQFQNGTVALQNNNFKRAAKLFRKATELDANFIPAYRLLGLAEELNGNLPAAAEHYKYVLEQDSLFSRLLYYQLGKVYYRMSQPAVAERYYLKFQDLQKLKVEKFARNGDEEREREEEVLAQLDRDLRAARITQDSSQFVNVTEVVNMGAPINTARDDYFPFFANDLNSFYYTRQGELKDEDLIQGKRNGAGGGWSTNRFGNFNTLQPEGMCTLVRDGERIYFTLCHEETSVGGCDLYTGWISNGKVERTEPLPDYINAPSWESQPAISCDGQQLFFASIRPGGIGGSDIYVCHKRADGTWSEPQNLGDGVNSPLDEEGPFLSNDGRTLYFSSMGHQGLGDQDIFMSYYDDDLGRFGPAINLGPPVNGPHRELGFHLGSDGRTGYFASDRPGGRGGLDIYEFQLSQTLTGRAVTYFSGYVTDSLTGEPITDQAVPVAGGNTYYTNYAGRFFVCAPAERPLSVTVDNAEYLPYARTFPVPRWDNREPYRVDLKLIREERPHVAFTPKSPAPAPAPKKPVAEPETVSSKARIVKRNLAIRFEFDDATLLPAQIENIKLFVASVIDKPITSIKVFGYTDDIGAEGYNLKLSQERARVVGDYLKAAGITATKTQIVGLGEVSGTGARKLNRKVEVKVVYREQLPVE